MALPNRNAADCVARRVARDEIVEGLLAEVLVQAALDDGEEVLRGGALVRGDAAVEPAQRAVARLLEARVVFRPNRPSRDGGFLLEVRAHNASARRAHVLRSPRRMPSIMSRRTPSSTPPSSRADGATRRPSPDPARTLSTGQAK